MSILIKTVRDLKDYRFFVPSYQRGYRWTDHEVTALLDDVNEFSTEGGKQYCIQPLIVKRRSDGSYEVVDGQQRLTTIYIFLKIAEEKTEYQSFTLEYETRTNSQTILSGLPPRDNKVNDDNIDYFHITSARNAINNWMDGGGRIRYNALSALFNKFTESVIFIWYELPDYVDPIPMFTKINLGKIPLTNAELIKALLLNKDNFSDDRDRRQTEISIAWDKTEQGLHDESFWYFLNEEDRSGTRIDLLFDLLAEKYNSKIPKPIPGNQNYFSFSVYSALLKAYDNKEEFTEKLFDEADNKEKFVEKLWSDVEKLYDEFRSWYADLNKYHIIGYLIASRMVEIGEIYTLTRGRRKSDITKALIEKARKVGGEYDLSILVYDNNTNARRKIRNLLLLFNIATLVLKSEKQYRFPFDIYKKEKWNIEHIHATADDSGEPDPSMGNLALLDEQTNKIYKAAPFDEKRSFIIKRESKGQFVPLCTKNVFLKVYSTDLGEMDKWDKKDKQDYIMAMEQTIKAFFDGEFIK